MPKKIILDMTGKKVKEIKWLLGLRYGKRKSIEALIMEAITEAMGREAAKYLREEGYCVKETDEQGTTRGT